MKKVLVIFLLSITILTVFKYLLSLKALKQMRQEVAVLELKRERLTQILNSENKTLKRASAKLKAIDERISELKKTTLKKEKAASFNKGYLIKDGYSTYTKDNL